MTETFADRDGRPLLTVFRFGGPMADGTHFLTAPEELLQVGLLVRPADHVVPPHAHNPVERRTLGTAEFLLVLEGLVEVTAFGEREYAAFRLGAGDAALVHPGCIHKVRWLTAAKVVEVKNGQFYGTDADKDRGGPDAAI